MSLGAVLTIDGISPVELGLGTFRNSQRPILSSTVDNTVTVPGMHGAYDFGATMGPKSFELECAFITRNHIELQQRVSALAAFCWMETVGQEQWISSSLTNRIVNTRLDT